MFENTFRKLGWTTFQLDNLHSLVVDSTMSSVQHSPQGKIQQIYSKETNEKKWRKTPCCSKLSFYHLYRFFHHFIRSFFCLPGTNCMRQHNFSTFFLCAWDQISIWYSTKQNWLKSWMEGKNFFCAVSCCCSIQTNIVYGHCVDTDGRSRSTKWHSKKKLLRNQRAFTHTITTAEKKTKAN